LEFELLFYHRFKGMSRGKKCIYIFFKRTDDQIVAGELRGEVTLPSSLTPHPHRGRGERGEGSPIPDSHLFHSWADAVWHSLDVVETLKDSVILARNLEVMTGARHRYPGLPMFMTGIFRRSRAAVDQELLFLGCFYVFSKLF
jgi:hypothetical protein